MEIKIPPETIADWVYRNFEVKPRKGGEELRIANPLVDDNGYHLNISITKAAVYDFRGNEWIGYLPETGKRRACTFIRFAQLYLEKTRGHCSFSEALADIFGSSTSAGSILRQLRNKTKTESPRQQEGAIVLPEGSVPFNFESPSKMDQSILSWLRGRGINDQKIKRYRLLRCGFDVVWPYYEWDAEPVYWQSRSRLNKKFLFPPENVGVTKGEFLFGFDLIEPASYLVIVEAIFCSMTLGDQVVASGGASLSPVQIKKIKAIGPKDGVILAADNDKAGLESILHNASLLRPLNYRLYYAIPPSIPFADDPNDKTKDWNDLVTSRDGRPPLMGDEEARKVFESSVKPFTIQARFYLQDRITQFKAIR